MKNKLILLGIAITALFIGCEDDSYDAPMSLSDVGFYTSKGQAKELQLNIYDFMSFSDLSQGTVSHTWSVDKGLNFLKGPIDRLETDFSSYIIYEGDTVTNDATIHVAFNESGMKKVRLYNTFKDSVAFRGHNGVDSYTLASQKVGTKWVIDTTFVVKVYDTIVPEIELKQNGVTINHMGTDTVYVEAGDVLNFIDKTTIGEPTGRTWSIRTAPKAGFLSTADDVIASSSAEDATILFKKLGSFIALVNVNRSGQNIPADGELLMIPVPIKVIPSSKPFVVAGSLKELIDETIQVPFNGEFAPFTNQEQFFTVKVNGTPFAIESVTTNKDDSTILEIKLENPIYRPDVITVSYAGGTLQSTDTRAPVAFTNLPVTMHNVNLMLSSVAGMETGAGWGPQYGLNNADISFSTQQAASGTSSLKIDITGQTNGFARCDGAKFDLQANTTYTFSFKIWIDPSKPKPNSVDLWLLTNWKQFWIGTSGIATGQWVTLSTEYKTGANAELSRVMTFRCLTANAIVYLDDFFVTNKEVRP